MTRTKNTFIIKVLKGESLSSIAEKYGLTVRELRRENRDVRFPQVDDYIRIPGVSTAEITNTEPVKTDTIVPIIERAGCQNDQGRVLIHR